MRLSYLILTPICLSFLPGGGLAGAAFTNYHLYKYRELVQLSLDTPPETPANFGIRAMAWYTPDDAETEASLSLPENGPEYFLSLGEIIGSIEFVVDFYGTRAELDTEYPNGNYAFSLFPDLQTSLSSTLTLTSDPLPAPVGLTNFAEIQLVNPGNDIQLDWSPTTLTGAEDCIQVGVYEWTGPSWILRTPDPGMPGALQANATSFTIPAGTLWENEFYSVFITVHDVTTVDTGQVPGATGTASLATTTIVDFETGTATAPDNFAPQLLGVNPSIGATGVNPLATVSFTFSEPMAPEISIHWSPDPEGGSFSYSWSQDATILTAIPDGPFPRGQSVRWTLNPDVDNSRMGDTSGNLFRTGAVSGSFKTAAVRFTTAPAEYLPGPVSVIQPDESGSVATIQFAAESLDGYLLQSSPDLENWGTMERVHTDASMAEMSVPIDSSSPDAFYRAVQFGTPPEFLTENDSGQSAMIYPEGGTLETTAADGIHYTLTIPPGALIAPTRITMTPLLEVVPSPFSGGLVAGVRLEPDGLSLMAPAELRMRMPAALDPTDLIGFQSKSDGFHFTWYPSSLPNDTDIVMQLVHFSVEGVGRGSQEDRDSQPPACDPVERMNQEIAKILALAEAAFRRGDEFEAQELILSTHPIIEAVHENIVSKAFADAKSNRNLLPCAIYDYITILAAAQLLGLELSEPADTTAAVVHAWEETRKKCREGDYREIANLFWLAANDQLLGFGALDQNAIIEALAECLAFKMDFRSDIHYSGIIHRAHHVQQAKDIELVQAELPTVVEGDGPLIYETFDLMDNYPCFDTGVRNVQKVNGGLRIVKGFIFPPDVTLRGCDCENKTMDPEGWNKLDFCFIIEFDSPTESWEESIFDFSANECVWFQQNATDWKNAMALVHEADINHQLSGEFFEPLVITLDTFDFVNGDSAGRREVARKQVFNFVPQDHMWVDFENVASETLITIWYDPR